MLLYGQRDMKGDLSQYNASTFLLFHHYRFTLSSKQTINLVGNGLDMLVLIK